MDHKSLFTSPVFSSATFPSEKCERVDLLQIFLLDKSAKIFTTNQRFRTDKNWNDSESCLCRRVGLLGVKIEKYLIS